MDEEHLQRKTRSHTVPTDQLSSSKSLNFTQKSGGILKMQSQIRKLKHLLTMQKQLHRNRTEHQKISSQISQFQEHFKVKRKEAIAEKLQIIQGRKNQRESHNRETNQALSKIKEEHKKRRQKMESIVSMYKQQYDAVYEKNIKRRKLQMKFNFQQIKVHESQYMKLATRRGSLRVKTQNSQNRHEELKSASPSQRQQSPILRREDQKLMKIKELARKRKEYGQQAERIAASIKITSDMVRKGKNYKKKGVFDDNIIKYEEQKRVNNKPPLNTNIRGDIEALQSREIDKIANKKTSPIKDKLTILQNLANGYKVKYDQGHEEALGKMCNINLTRAQLLLNDI